MKNILKLFIGILLAAHFIACSSQAGAGKAPKMETNLDTVSYVIGLWIATGPANVPDKEELNLELIKKGIADGFSEKDDTVFTPMKLQEILRNFSMQQQQKQAEVDAIEHEENKKIGQEFLEKNKTAKGVVETESGLQYRVIKEGAGAQPLATDKVRVHYTGKLIDGDIFDSSHDRGQPTEFVLNQVIKGWTEGLQLMKEGAIYEFFIPYELAYGERAAGEKIKPNSTLIFEVELIEVLKAEEVVEETE